MLNVTLLKIALIRAHLSVVELCEKCGFSTAYFYKCARNEQDFRTTEAKAICDCLHIGSDEMMKIFFASDVGKMETEKEET